MITQAQKDLWIENLTNGKYMQGTGSLNNADTDTYCCLGVLLHQVFERCFDISDLPRKSSYGWLDEQLGGDNVRQLMILNDHPTQMTFPEIAEWIKENIKAA